MGFNDGATSLPYFPQKLGANSANCANKVYDNDGNVLPTMADGSNNPCISKMIPPRGLYILCNKNADSTTLSDKCHHENAGLGVNFDGDDFLVLAQLRFQDLTTGPTDEQCTPSTEDTTCTLTPTNTDTETGGSCAVDAGSGVCAYSDAEPRAFVSLECPASGDTILKDPNGAVLPGAAMDAFGVCGAGASQWSPHTANYRKYQVVEPSSKYRAWEWTQVAGWAMSEACLVTAGTEAEEAAAATTCTLTDGSCAVTTGSGSCRYRNEQEQDIDLALSGKHETSCDGQCLPQIPCGTSEDALIISEVGKGQSNNKWVEIYNPTDHAIDLAPDGGVRFYLVGLNNGATSLSSSPQKLGQDAGQYNKCAGTAEDMVDGKPNPCWTKSIPARGLYIICNSGCPDLADGSANPNCAITTLSGKCHHLFGGPGVNFNGDDFLMIMKVSAGQLKQGG